MTRFNIVGAAAVLSLYVRKRRCSRKRLSREPGAFAFFYPNNDVLNGGRPTPAAGMDAKMPVIFGRQPVYGHERRYGWRVLRQRYRLIDRLPGRSLGTTVSGTSAGNWHDEAVKAAAKLRAANRDGRIGSDAGLSGANV